MHKHNDYAVVIRKTLDKFSKTKFSPNPRLTQSAAVSNCRRTLPSDAAIRRCCLSLQSGTRSFSHCCSRNSYCMQQLYRTQPFTTRSTYCTQRLIHAAIAAHKAAILHGDCCTQAVTSRKAATAMCRLAVPRPF